MHTGEVASARPSNDATHASGAADPAALVRYRLLLVATAVGVLLGTALHVSGGREPRLLPLLSVPAAPLLARAVAHHVSGAYAVLSGLVLAALIGHDPTYSGLLFVRWSLVITLSYLVFRRPVRSALPLSAATVLAGAALVLAERHVDLGAPPLDRMLVGFTLFLVVVWALSQPLDVLAHGWECRAPHVARSLAWLGAGIAYLGVVLGLLTLLTHESHSTWASTGSAVLVLFMLGVVYWQATRISTLHRVSRALTEAAVTTPWPTDDILGTLTRLVTTHIRAARVAVLDRPTDGSLWAPLDRGRYLVVERQRGEFGFTRRDAQLVAGLSSMARASLEYADRERRLQRQAITDPLTGLWSYQHWLELLLRTSAEIGARAEDPRRLGVVFLDCDGFKQINNRYGHLDADQILATIGERLRRLSANAGWCFSRFGGDEFTGWLLEDGGPAAFEKRCEELAAVLAEPIGVSHHTVTVTASIGRALADPTLGPGGETVDELVESAEIDMRRRKLRKPGAVLTRHTDRDVVRRILDSGAIKVAYQPIVSLTDRRIWGCEALLRGHTGALGLIPPPVLVESASQARLLDAVTAEVMEQAIGLTEQARAVSGRPLVLTLNLEIEQFHHASELLDRVVARVDASGVPVVLELSERQPLPWTPERSRLARELADHGIGVGLDDLGAGESRLTLLGARPWDLVKLDRGLLLEDHDGRGPVVLRHLTAILDAYGLRNSLLEGIETAAQERVALDLGIRYAQGNGYGAADDGAELLRLLSLPQLPALP